MNNKKLATIGIDTNENHYLDDKHKNYKDILYKSTEDHVISTQNEKYILLGKLYNYYKNCINQVNETKNIYEEKKINQSNFIIICNTIGLWWYFCKRCI